MWISSKGTRWGFIRSIPQIEMDSRDVSLIAASATIDWETLLAHHQGGRTAVEYVPLPKYPSSKRDLALAVPESVPYTDVERTIRASAGDILIDLRLFDIYRGKQLEKGKISMAFNLTFQDSERTLTDEMVDERIKAILTALETNLKVLLRDK